MNRLSITVLHNLIVDDIWSDIRVAGFWYEMLWTKERYWYPVSYITD